MTIVSLFDDATKIMQLMQLHYSIRFLQFSQNKANLTYLFISLF